MLIPFPLAPRPRRDSELGLPNQQLKRVFSTLAHQLQVVTGRNVSPSTLTAAERYEQATGLD
jgi:RecB family endonuclease NucS